jgi:hypothetical protein
MPVVLAHQGGWDEMLMVAIPILAIAGLLRLAKRRVSTRQTEQSAQSAASSVDSDRSMSAPSDRSRPTRSS